MLKQAGAVVVLFIAAAAALGQEGHFDGSINGSADFTKGTQGNGVTQSASTSAGYFASLRLKLAPMFWLEGNYGRTENSQFYNSSTSYRIQGRITELTGDLVVRPWHIGKFQTFLFGGGGVLVFNPTQTLVILVPPGQTVATEVPVALGAAREYRTTVIYGGGVDYKLISRFALRLQYRGLFFTAPDYKLDIFTDGKAHMAEPSVGLVFRF